MDKTTNVLLGITVIFVLCMMTVPAFADSDMVCKDSHVPVERTNGKMACLTESTAEKTAERFGWTVLVVKSEMEVHDSIQNMMNDTLDEKMISSENIHTENTALRITHDSSDWMVHASPGYALPWFEFDFPSQISVGDTFEINIPYTYVIFDPEDGDIDQVREEHPDFTDTGENYSTHFILKYPEELVLQNKQDFDKVWGYYDSRWEKSWERAKKEISYDITSDSHNIRFEFLLNNAISYPNDKIDLSHGLTVTPYYVNPIDDETFELSLERKIPSFAFGAEPQPPCPYCNTGKGWDGENHPHSNRTDHKHPTDIEGMVLFLETFDFPDWLIPGMFANIEEYLYGDYDEWWVDEFLEKYPQFRAHFVDFFLQN